MIGVKNAYSINDLDTSNNIVYVVKKCFLFFIRINYFLSVFLKRFISFKPKKFIFRSCRFTIIEHLSNVKKPSESLLNKVSVGKSSEQSGKHGSESVIVNGHIELSENNSDDSESRESISRFHIAPILDQDGGQISCEVANRYGRDSKTFLLSIEGNKNCFLDIVNVKYVYMLSMEL